MGELLQYYLSKRYVLDLLQCPIRLEEKTKTGSQKFKRRGTIRQQNYQ
jgi:hypothetical protein